MNLPSINGNWVDLFALIFLVLYVAMRFSKGFIHGTVDMATFLASLVIALKFYPYAAILLVANFSLTRGIAQALGFFLVTIIAEFLLFLLSLLLFRYISPKILHSQINKLLGFFPAFLSGIILLAFFFTSVITLPVRPDVKQSVSKSRIGNFLSQQTFGLERVLGKVFGGALEETLTFLTVKPEGNESVDLRFTTKEVTADASSESKMLELVNRERIKEGVDALVADEPLRKVARDHCVDMFLRGYFSHYTPDGASPFDRMDKAGISYQIAGENLAYAPSVDIAHTGLMNSPGHRKNILSPDYGRVGIGIIDAGIYGKMFCQEFSN